MTHRSRFLAIIVCAATLGLLTGCRSVASYGASRVMDMTDIVTFNGGVGLGLSANVHVTQHCGTVVGVSRQKVVGWGQDEENLPSHTWYLKRSASLGDRGEWGLLFVGVEGGDYVGGDASASFLFRRAPYFGTRPYNWPESLNVGGGVCLGLISAHVDFSPIQLADLFTGLVGVDLARDDIYFGLPDRHYTTVASEAIEGNVETVRYLLNHGRSTAAVAGERHPALYHAARGGHIRIIKLLLARGAEVNAGAGGNGTPLHGAAFGGEVEAAKLLLSEGARIHAYRSDGATPLHFTTFDDEVKVAELLLARGAMVDAKDEEGLTPLGWAAQRGAPQVAQLLIQNGADVESVARLLIHNGADVESGASPPLTRVAAEEWNWTVLELLAQAEANVNWKTDEGDTVLSMVIRYVHNQEQQRRLIRLLLEAGAAPNLPGQFGSVPFHTVIRRGDPEQVRYFIQHGARPNVRDEDGETPLHHAVSGGHRTVVRILLEAGADPRLTDNRGRRPADLTEDKSLKELLRGAEHRSGRN